MSPSDRVHTLLEPVVAGEGLVLEDVTVTPAGKRRVLRVVVDLPEDAEGSVDLDAVADVSRAVSAALDDSDVLGGAPYVLEVTSPGVDRPLTERRHWSRARGRLVQADLVQDGGGREGRSDSVTGRVVQVDDEGVTMEVDGERTVLAWDELRRGRVQVEFNRSARADDESVDDETVDDEPVADGGEDEG